MTETVAAIVAAHRAGTMTPAQTVARSYQRIRDHNDPAVFISLRDEKDALAEAEAPDAKGCRAASASWRAGRRQGQYRRAGHADHRRLPGLLLHAGAGFDGGGETARGRRHHHRQDQSRSVRDRPRRRPLALRHSRQSDPRRSDSGRIEFGIGGRGFRRAGAAGARHRHRRQRPRAGDAQQHRRTEAEPRADLERRPGAGLPDARLHLGVLADRRRRDDGADGDGGRRWRRSVLARPAARRDDRVSRPTPARRAAQRPADLLRRQRLGEGLWRGARSAGPRSAPRWSNSISNRSTRPRGCSTKDRGSPSAIW